MSSSSLPFSAPLGPEIIFFGGDNECTEEFINYHPFLLRKERQGRDALFVCFGADRRSCAHIALLIQQAHALRGKLGASSSRPCSRLFLFFINKKSAFGEFFSFDKKDRKKQRQCERVATTTTAKHSPTDVTVVRTATDTRAAERLRSIIRAILSVQSKALGYWCW